MVLEHGGHTVRVAMNEDEIRDACLENCCEVAVIGQVTLPDLKYSAFRTVREHSPDARVLELHEAYHSPLLGGADDWLEVPTEVPHDLLDRVNHLARNIDK